MTEIKQIDRDAAELKPCPFCGGDAGVSGRGPTVCSPPNQFVVCCRNGFCTAYRMHGWEWKEEWAIAAWNTRTTAEAEVEAYRTALEAIAGPPERDPELPPIYEPRWSAGQCRDIARQALNTHASRSET